MHADSFLAPSFKRLEYALRDFRQTVAIDNAVGLVGRIVEELDKEPMRGFVAASLPPADFQKWWFDKNGGRLHTSGTRAIDWPADTALRVALQVDASRRLASKDINIVSFAHQQFNAGRNPVDSFRKMSDGMLAPMVRDLDEMASERPASHALTQLVRHRPRSEEAMLDELLDEACTAFLDPSPQAHRRALERLWDAWERAKTVRNQDKKVGAELMLDAGAPAGSTFREMLGREAKALTDIGNDFHIRHHETNRAPIDDPEQVDYLFHRLLAMLQLVLR